ncbi:hypothetical protein [Peribacillus frigoritolerans]|nr:hypothetical protein [Peribacillus frigoritolerans]
MSLSDIFESLIDIFKSLGDIFESLIDILEISAVLLVYLHFTREF